MSATIGINDLKFVIFGAGHDYTLADSGDGDVQVFSHPFVPKNSKNYAGQWYFLVPDEDGNPLDAVKDDIAHCTFTPAIGSTFSTVGEVTVECHYHREYVHDEETIVVDKTVSQVIQVVNHGSKSETGTNLDIYSDGYGFIRPSSTSVVEEIDYVLGQKNAVTKLSSIPWRATGLGADNLSGFFRSDNLTDISELAFADTSNCTKFYLVFEGDRSLSDISPIANWNVSNVKVIRFFCDYTNITSLQALATWQTQSLESLEYAFAGYAGTTLEGLEHWNVSNVIDARNLCDGAENLADITALSGWDMSKVATLRYAFYNTSITNVNAFASWKVPALVDIESIFQKCDDLADLSGLAGWKAELEVIRYAFADCDSRTNLNGVGGLDVHLVEDFTGVFQHNEYLTSIAGLEDWDVSSGVTFSFLFYGDHWISDASPLSGWDMSHADAVESMFNGIAFITDLDDFENWRMNPSIMSNMFFNGKSCYSSKIAKSLWYTAYYYYDYEGNQYTNAEVQDVDNPLTYPTYNAYKARNWGVTGSGKNAFESYWTNKPSWN